MSNCHLTGIYLNEAMLARKERKTAEKVELNKKRYRLPLALQAGSFRGKAELNLLDFLVADHPGEILGSCRHPSPSRMIETRPCLASEFSFSMAHRLGNVAF